MRKRSSLCVLVSGGLDSDVLLADMARRYDPVWPVYIRQGLVWENVEVYWLKKFLTSLSSASVPPPSFPAVVGGESMDPRPVAAGDDERKRFAGNKISRIQPLTVLSLPMADLYGAHWSTGRKAVPGARSKDEAVYLPGRNLVLSVKAAVFAAKRKAPLLALGSLDHNPFPDATPQFFKAWGNALGCGLGTRLRVLAPYRKLSKVDVIRRGRHLPLALSFSCIAPKGRLHCGRCNKCAERRRAFRAAKVDDKTKYAKN